MKYKLLFVFAIFFITSAGYSQIAPPVENLRECDGSPADGKAIFNMYNDANPQILNAQDVPEDYTVTYYTTLANAIANTNFINNYDYYENLTNPQTIYYRVQKIATGEYAISTFQLIVIQQVNFSNITACEGGYTLEAPLYGYGNYYTGPNGTGTLLPYGTVITTSQTIYVDFGCPDYNTSFTITVEDMPPYSGPDGTIVCDSYTLPPLDANSYYTNANGAPLAAGDVLTTSQAVVVTSTYTGVCILTVNIYIDVVASLPNEITANGCDAQNNGQAYFDLSTAFNTVVANHTSLQVTYHKTLGQAQAGTDALSPQYTNTDGLTKLYAKIVTNNGACSHIITVNLVGYTFDYGTPDVVTGCDPDGNGLGLFNLEPAQLQIANGNNTIMVAFYGTEADALAASAPIDFYNIQAYQNTTPFSQTIYAVATSQGNCSQIIPVTLTTLTNCTLKTVTGTVRYNDNGTGCTAASAPVGNIPIQYTNGLYNFTTYTNALGQYTIEGVTDGSVLALNDPFDNFVGGEVIFEGAETTTVTDLCMVPATNAGTNVWLSLVPTTVARPNFMASYTLFLQNSSGTEASGYISITFNGAKLNYFPESSPFIQVGINTLTLIYDLAPYSSGLYTPNFLVADNSVTVPGQTLEFTATAVQTDDIDTTNNTAILEQTIVNSYDPNDITVHQGGVITLDQANDYLDYTIRFQNTGTADAVDIKIATELDSNLDPGTFIPVGSGHDFSVQMAGNVAIFTFNNINLPSQAEDEALSQGYVSYRVKPGIAYPGIEYNAQANIFFDGNAPVATNVATTIIENILAVATITKDSFIIYPNPASGTVILQLPNLDSADVMVTDIIGKTVYSKNNIAPDTVLDISSLNSGMYFVTVFSKGKITTKKLIVK